MCINSISFFTVNFDNNKCLQIFYMWEFLNSANIMFVVNFLQILDNTVESFTEMNRESRVFIRFPYFLNQIISKIFSNTPIALFYPRKLRGMTREGANWKRGLFLWKMAGNGNFFIFNFWFIFHYIFFYQGQCSSTQFDPKKIKIRWKMSSRIFF